MASWFLYSFRKPTSGIMTSGWTSTPFLLHEAGRLEDGAGLHGRDLGIDDSQAAAPMTEHRVHFVQLFHAARDRASTPRTWPALGPAPAARRWCSERNSCSGGSSKRIVTGRPGISRNRPAKSLRWNGRILASAFSRPLRVGHDHLADFGEMVEEHMLGAAQADPLGPEGDRHSGLVGQVGIGADPHLAVIVDPGHQLGVPAVRFGVFRLHRLVDQHLDDFAGLRRHLAFVDFAREAIDADLSPGLRVLPLTVIVPL